MALVYVKLKTNIKIKMSVVVEYRKLHLQVHIILFNYTLQIKSYIFTQKILINDKQTYLMQYNWFIYMYNFKA